jgi:hypothetical protein
VSIHIGSLKRDTREAIHRLYESLGMDAISDSAWWELERVAELFFILKYHKDEAWLFPHGKWATLQAIEDMIRRELEQEPTR